MSNAKISHYQKYLLVGIVSSLLTVVALTVLRNFVLENPVMSIFLIILSIPILLPINKFALPYLRIYLRKYIVVIAIGSLTAVMALSLTKFVFLAFLLFIHIAMSIFLKTFKRHHVGIEIVLLITVLSGVAYGPKVGAFMGALSMLLDYIFSARISMFSIVTIPAYALIGVLASVFASANLFILGMGLAVFYSLFTWIFILGFMGGDIDKCIRFAVTNLVFNAIVFSIFAPNLLRLMV